MMEMYERCYYGIGGDDDGDWFKPLSAIPPPCSSSWSPSPSLLLRREEKMDMSGYLPITASAVAELDHYMYQPFQGDHFVNSSLPAVAAAGGATASGSHDDELLRMPFTDIDLDAFADVRDVVGELKSSPQHILDAAIVLASGGGHHFATQNDARRDMEFNDMKQQDEAADLVGDDSLSMVVVEGYEMGVRYAAAEQEQKPKIVPAATSETTPLPLPPSLPPPRVVRSRRDGLSVPASGKTRLDHIGFEDLRRYFYMPITKAAREMNVGLTVLKKRCRELGVARWPHRKMKSLKSLILNVQEMGSKGMSAAAMRRELEELENICALMERNPTVELTERTKKLRQAYFKENYKRRKVAAVDILQLDHCFSFAAGHGGHHHQQRMQLDLPPPPPLASVGEISSATDRR